MTIEQAYSFLARTHPGVIHLSSKTSTGKSTCQTGVLTDDLTKAIRRYARVSQEASEKRLAGFQAVFKGVVVAYL